MPGYRRPKIWQQLIPFLLGLPSDIFFVLKHWGKNYPCPPLYPDAQSLQKYSLPDRPQFRVYFFETPDSPYAVLAFYKKHLRRDGWQLYEENLLQGRIKFLYLHPRLDILSLNPDYLPRPIHFHSEVRPWYSLEFRMQPVGSLLQVEIVYSVGASSGWRDTNF